MPITNTELLQEILNPLAQINPSSTSATQNSSYVSMASRHHIAALIFVGTIAATGTLDIKLQQAKDSSGTSVKDITGKALTQLTNADSPVTKPLIIEVRADELDVAGGFTHVRLVVAAATAASLVGAALFGVDQYLPVTSSQWKQALV